MPDYPFRIIGLEQEESALDLSDMCRKLQEMGYYCRAAKIKLYEEDKLIVCYCYRDFPISEMKEFLASFDLYLNES